MEHLFSLHLHLKSPGTIPSGLTSSSYLSAQQSNIVWSLRLDAFTISGVKPWHTIHWLDSLITSPDLNDVSRAMTGVRWDRSFAWPRERTSKDKHSVKVVYGWTSLTQKRCCPQHLLALIRAHWAVEIGSTGAAMQRQGFSHFERRRIKSESGYPRQAPPSPSYAEKPWNPLQ